MNWSEILDESYDEYRIIIHDDCSKEEFLCSLMNFTLYDSGEITNLFAKYTIEVAVAITNRTTFDYIKDQENYKWYLIMMNISPFLENVDWGTSVRGAWWDSEITLDTCDLFKDGEQLLSPKFTKSEWDNFILSLEKFMSSVSP